MNVSLSLKISRIICIFSFCSLRPNRTVVQKRTLKKNTKQKSKNKDNDSNVQSKADSDEDETRKSSLERLPPKTKTFFAFYDGFAKSNARDKKWIQCTECLLWAHIECLDAEIHMYVCEYCK